MSSPAAVSSPSAAEQPARSAVMIGALGVVFGAIDNRESLKAAHYPTLLVMKATS
jgi:hypothetical protein